jgi:predicted nucleic acid-binding protein
MEVLAGARDNASEGQLRRMLRRFVVLVFDPVVDFEGAVRTYRLCRSAGVPPRSLIDCTIASVAMRH